MDRTPARRIALAVILLVCVNLGCTEARPQGEKWTARPAEAKTDQFNPATAGTIRGRVTWHGDIPSVLPFEIPPNPQANEVLRQRQVRPNPNAPLIDPRTRGVGNAVVFLRGLDPAGGRRWNHAPVRIEQRACELHILQGNVDSAYGFVQRGESLEMVSRDRVLHSLHAGGAAFFTLTFPDPGEPLARSCREKGIVELTSAAGYYWMRAYLFVDDHPYYARTDQEGRFTLTEVPPGTYELACWLPNWKEARHERDPESGMISRLFFAPPIEEVLPIELHTGDSRSVDFEVPGGLGRSP
jgi:hypothetical protein